ncbi:chondroitin sulfate synthase 1-like [Haliotis rubra]|uniref:chondroitin sulfate synthase 1-like n=1 Tax=Haliotis rubra TaxID=36100 RepID=UPI001EE57831|nr:chondroitin sulfate synthase 1-like [Haliotis rubra]
MGKGTSWTIVHCVLMQLILGILIGLFTSQASLEVFRWRRRSLCRLPKDGSGQRHKKLQLPRDSERHIFAGVMTSRKHLQTRADAIYKTWGKDFPGQLVFFIGTGEDFNTSLPVVVLTNVSDEAYPPQRKSFEMLRYMSQHHGNDFHWFMRLDDDVYVNTDLLKTFLTSINSSLHEYMGHSGLGAIKEIGHLGLHGKTPYCLGGPGVVLSGPILRQVAPHLSGCLKNPATPHEDTELGRCIHNVTGLSCSEYKQLKYMFFQNFKDASGAWAEKLLPRYLHKMISFHPIKQPVYQFILQKTMLSSKLQTKLKQAYSLEREKSFINTSRFKKKCESTPCDADNGEVWTCIKGSYVYSMESADLKDSTSDRGRHLYLASLRHSLKLYIKSDQLKKAQVTYYRVSALNGLEHAVVTADGKKHRLFRTRQTFPTIFFRELTPK